MKINLLYILELHSWNYHATLVQYICAGRNDHLLHEFMEYCLPLIQFIHYHANIHCNDMFGKMDINIHLKENYSHRNYF